jgi:hypothetical protein
MNREDIKQIAAALKLERTSVVKRAQKESWPYTEVTGRGGKRRLYEVAKLPAAVQAALALYLRPATHEITEALAAAELTPGKRRAAPSAAEIADRSARYVRLAPGYRETAEKRLRALLAVQALVQEGQKLTVARELVAARISSQGEVCSPESLWRWAKDVSGVPRAQWLHFLVPHWTGRTKTADCSPEAWRVFQTDYPRRILLRLEPAYLAAGWPGSAVCPST